MPYLVTWNMQGGSATTELKWRTGVQNMLSNMDPKPDYICLQETGAMPASAKELEKRSFNDPSGGTTEVVYYSWEGHSIAFHNWDKAGNRVNTAVVSKEFIEPKKANLTLVWGPKPIWRPALGLWIGGSWVFSFHAISPGGPDAAGLLDSLAKTVKKEAWLLGADFNREPNTLQIPEGSVLCEPSRFTHKVPHTTKKLDYFVSTIPPQTKGGVLESISLSDHYPVMFGF